MMKCERFLLLPVIAAVLVGAGCGGSGSGTTTGGSTSSSTGGSGGGSGSTTNNVAPLIVDAGPPALILSGLADEDLAFTKVTICVPGTTTCQNLDHVQVDTGSEGLRLPMNVSTLSLPPQTANGNPVSECVQFADLSFIWGTVVTADIQIAGESAKGVPIQLANNNVPPTACSPNQNMQLETVSDFGANGIIGVGLFRQDCGPGCASTANNNVYFTCVAGACTSTAQSLATQLQNPVWMFASDNNGVLVQLPSISSTGAATATGSLIFGIGTQSDNSPGSAVALQPDPNTGNFAASFNGVLYNDVNGKGPGGSGGSSFIDSGSNGFFFLDSATLTNPPNNIPIPDCPNSGNGMGFYCPASSTPISVNVIGESSSGTPVGSGRTITFNIQNASSLFQLGGSAFNDVGGPNSNSFDFGLPFFFGQNIFFGIEGQSTPLGTGPLYAF